MNGRDCAKCQNQDKRGHKWQFLLILIIYGPLGFGASHFPSPKTGWESLGQEDLSSHATCQAIIG